jgi:hypothetical protein
MSSEQPRQTLADCVALAFSPALIMGLVGSLVFFLLEVAYSGEYEGRLQWILFFFVFGAVLVARISITQGDGKAGLYGLVLGLLTWIGMQSFVEYPAGSPAADLAPLINLGLVAVVWWCAHRLTWDCTHIDEETDSGGEGLLQAAGIEQPPPQVKDDKKEKEEEGTPYTPTAGWWQRYQRYREERKKKRNLGVWVVYFSLAALPLFGLGQSLIPAGEAARRRYAFWLMTVYVGCGLGLLLTTCFLGLRRYLRQRKLQMPVAMTGAWLSAGATLIVLLLAAGAFLPRPEAEYPLFDFGGRAGSEKRGASQIAFKGDSPGKDKGRGGSQGEHDPRAEANAGKAPGKQGQGGDNPKQGQDGDGQGQEKSGQGSSGKGKDKQGYDGSEKSGQDQQEPGRNQEPKKGGERAEDNQAQGGKDAPQGKDAAQGNQGSEVKRKGESSSGGSSESSSSFSGVREAVRGLAGILKWVVFALVALVVLFVFLRAVLQFLANFTSWAQSLLDFFRNFWTSLFGGPRRTRAASEDRGEEEAAAPEKPFASFTNPFTDGSARRLSVRELIRYTFAAVQAWARERGMGRQPGETALEFVERVCGEVPALEDELRRLVMLYGRAEYARGGVPAGAVEAVREFWDRLEVVVEQPMSA